MLIYSFLLAVVQAIRGNFEDVETFSEDFKFVGVFLDYENICAKIWVTFPGINLGSKLVF